jgi:hypothetical protein
MKPPHKMAAEVRNFKSQLKFALGDGTGLAESVISLNHVGRVPSRGVY